MKHTDEPISVANPLAKSPARRQMLQGGFVALCVLAFTTSPARYVMATETDPSVKLGQSKKIFPYTLTDAEWRKKLTPEQYYVLREHGTERAGTCPLNEEKRGGTFYCAGCGIPLFSGHRKFESGTGWPSFNEPLPGAVETSVDYKIGLPRTEVHCANCGGHLGHVFDDGPPPTGKRYCVNGVAMLFIPEEEMK